MRPGFRGQCPLWNLSSLKLRGFGECHRGSEINVFRHTPTGLGTPQLFQLQSLTSKHETPKKSLPSSLACTLPDSLLFLSNTGKLLDSQANIPVGRPAGNSGSLKGPFLFCFLQKAL